MIMALPTMCFCQSGYEPASFIQFDKPSIIDSVAADNIDTRKYRYFFSFTNLADKPVFVERVFYSDPDFSCSVPVIPILKYQKDSIGICLTQQQLMRNFNKQYTVLFTKSGSPIEYSTTIELKRVLIYNSKE